MIPSKVPYSLARHQKNIIKEMSFPTPDFGAIYPQMKILVTGGSGFVGSWLIQRLLKENVQVHALRRKSSSAKMDEKNLNLVWGDVTNRDSMIAATKDIDSVFHLAGHVGYSRADREMMEKINVQGTQNVIDACKVNGVRRLIHMSSVVAVGASFDGKKALDETSEFNLHDLDLGYFETKWAAEQLVRKSVADGQLDAVMVNPSTIYGAGDAAKGSRKVQLKVAQGKFKFYTGGGVSVVGVEEVADAVVAAWKKGIRGERYILAGDNITIKDLFAMIAGAAGQPAPSILLPNSVIKTLGAVGDQLEKFGRKGPLNSETAWTSILYHWFDHYKAEAQLDFKPQPALGPITKSVNWMREKGLLQ